MMRGDQTSLLTSHLRFNKNHTKRYIMYMITPDYPTPHSAQQTSSSLLRRKEDIYIYIIHYTCVHTPAYAYAYACVDQDSSNEPKNRRADTSASASAIITPLSPYPKPEDTPALETEDTYRG
ncbi:hypothetical protein H2248_011476 [Termitomyces sp. 'cryptogamus']|nr:hypothetical protein H2248_011476 [Termitomyces sp. 'cryptogamus']